MWNLTKIVITLPQILKYIFYLFKLNTHRHQIYLFTTLAYPWGQKKTLSNIWIHIWKIINVNKSRESFTYTYLIVNTYDAARKYSLKILIYLCTILKQFERLWWKYQLESCKCVEFIIQSNHSLMYKNYLYLIISIIKYQ